MVQTQPTMRRRHKNGKARNRSKDPHKAEPKKPLVPPRLSRAGTLREMTAGMNGIMLDGGSGMSKA